MKELRRLLVVVPAILLVLCLVASYLTRGAMANLSFLKGKGTKGSLVDQRPWQTVEALAPLAVSSEEQSIAREAERLADHEVDQAFSQAMRQATIDTHSLSEAAQAIQQKVAKLQA